MEKIEFKQEELELLDLNTIYIYADGACSGNPGIGAYTTILLFKRNDGSIKQTVLREAFDETTNNKMELSGLLMGLRELKSKRYPVKFVSDSKYVIDSFNQGWIDKWKTNGWRKTNREPVKNVEIWKEVLSLMEGLNISFEWVKGHNDNPFNEMCDLLARNAIKEQRDNKNEK